jgi:hypothetical protein
LRLAHSGTAGQALHFSLYSQAVAIVGSAKSFIRMAV